MTVIFFPPEVATLLVLKPVDGHFPDYQLTEAAGWELLR